MDHKSALAEIPSDVAAALTARSDRKGLTHLAGHLALIAITGSLIAAQIPYWGLLLPVHGILLTFLFALEHETTHQTAFANPRLGDTLGRLCGVLLMLPFEWFRYFHLAHHRHTNDPDKDPELGNPKPNTWPAYLLHLTGWRYWWGLSGILITNALGRADAPYLPSRALPRIALEARIMLGLYTLAGLSLLINPALLWLWIVPMLLGQPFLRLYLLAEHGRCAFVANMLENTRTTYTNRFVRFIAWNMPYHADHHAAPQVPFHKLPELNAHLRDHLKETANGYAAYTAQSMRALK